MIMAGLIGSTPISKFNLVIVLLIPIIIGICTSSNNDTYLVLKDAFYLSLPIIFLVLGIFLPTFISLSSFCKIIVLSGTLVSILIIIMTVYRFGLSALINPFAARYEIGTGGNPLGNPTPILAIAILLFQKKFGLKLFSNKTIALLVTLNAIVIYTFASRTYLLFLMIFLFFFIVDSLSVKIAIRFTVVLLAMVLVFALIQPGSGSSSSLTEKIVNSSKEVNFSNYGNEEDIIYNYRGYESYTALNQFREGTFSQMVFGKLGKIIDLGIYLNLGGNEMRYVPILHNGYIYALLKVGVFGMLFYSFFFLLIGLRSWNIYTDAGNPVMYRFLTGLMLATIAGLLITHYVVYSIFNIEMSILLIFVGYGYALTQQLPKRSPVSNYELHYATGN